MVQVQPAEPVHYLTRLPTELLHYICELVIPPHRERYRIGFISKTFLPFARHQLFKFVWVSSATLVKFIKLVEASPGVGPYIKKLTVDFNFEGEKGAAVTGKAFLKLLGRLSGVEELTMRQATQLIKAFLSDSKSRHLLPALRNLTVSDDFSGWASPFDPTNWSRLQRHPELFLLDMDVRRTPESLGRYKPPSKINILTKKWKWNLLLRGPLSENPAVNDLLHAVNQIITLTLVETSRIKRFPHVLADVPFYDDVQIHFRTHAFHSSLISTLQALPSLEELNPDLASNVTGTDIKLLLAPTNLFPKLLRITPPRLQLYYETNEQGSFVWLVEYDDSFTQKDGEEILELCEARSVTLSGLTGDTLWLERSKREAAAKRKTEEREAASAESD